jgi:hypothetical protein
MRHDMAARVTGVQRSGIVNENIRDLLLSRNLTAQLLSEKADDARSQSFLRVLRTSFAIVLDNQFQLTVSPMERDIDRAAPVAGKSILECISD